VPRLVLVNVQVTSSPEARSTVAVEPL